MSFARSFQTKMNSEINGSVDENPDNNILELAIDFAVRGPYPPGLSKDKSCERIFITYYSAVTPHKPVYLKIIHIISISFLLILAAHRQSQCS